MGVFLVVPTEAAEAIGKTVRENFPSESYSLPRGEWLIAFGGTTRELSDKLGISEGQSGSAIIVSVMNYWGYASKDIWEWISVKERQA